MKAKVFMGSVLLLLTLMILTGCGASIEGKININPDSSGSRTIICKISRSDIDKLKGGERGFDDIIKKNKPSVMSYEKTLEGDSIVYTFTYDFKDFNEYISKTQQMTGKKPESSLKITGNGLNRSYSFYERNQASDIIQWAIDEVERQGVNGIALGELYEIGTTEVNLLGYKKYFNGDINISAEKQFRMETVNIETRFNSLTDISRNIQYVFSDDTERALNINGELRKYIEKLVPSGARYERTPKESKVYYEINYSAQSVNELNTKTRKATMDESAALSISDTGQKSYSSVSRGLTDSISFVKLTGGNGIDSGINYKLRIPVTFSIKRILDYNPSATGDKPQGFEIKNEIGSSIINYPINDNKFNFIMEYTTQRANSYFLIWIIGILIVCIMVFILIRYVTGERNLKVRKASIKQDTLSFDKDWEVEINKRLQGKNIK